MRPLTNEEADMLRDMARVGPPEDADDAEEAVLMRLVERGCVLTFEEDEWTVWRLTPLGRLALSVSVATRAVVV